MSKQHVFDLARLGRHQRARQACPGCKGRDLAGELAVLREALDKLESDMGRTIADSSFTWDRGDYADYIKVLFPRLVDS